MTTSPTPDGDLLTAYTRALDEIWALRRALANGRRGQSHAGLPSAVDAAALVRQYAEARGHAAVDPSEASLDAAQAAYRALEEVLFVPLALHHARSVSPER